MATKERRLRKYARMKLGHPAPHRLGSCTDAEFLVLWEMWDAQPSHVDNAALFCDACEILGERCGLAHNEFRDRLTTLRRAGFDRAACLAGTLASVGAVLPPEHDRSGPQR